MEILSIPLTVARESRKSVQQKEGCGRTRRRKRRRHERKKDGGDTELLKGRAGGNCEEEEEGVVRESQEDERVLGFLSLLFIYLFYLTNYTLNTLD